MDNNNNNYINNNYNNYNSSNNYTNYNNNNNYNNYNNQYNNQMEEKINCPQITCIVFLVLSILLFLYILISSYDFLTKLYFFIHIILYSLILFFIHKGIADKKYSFYLTGLIISIVFNVIITIIYLFGIIAIGIGEEENQSLKAIIIIILCSFILICWILTIVLFYYKKKVTHLCEAPPLISPSINALPPSAIPI